jgi:hypothetical protein
MSAPVPPKPAESVIRQRLDEVTRELAAEDVEPAAQAALELEGAKLRKLLARCFQSEGPR